MGIQMRKVLIVFLAACTALTTTAQDSMRRSQTGFIQTGIGKSVNKDAVGPYYPTGTGFSKGVSWEPLHIGIGLGKHGGICAAYMYIGYSKQLAGIREWYASSFPGMVWNIQSGSWKT